MIRVTHAIKAAGLIDSEWFTPEATSRGTAVHAATELDDMGDLDETSVHPAVAPFLESWRRFRKEIGWPIWEGHIEVEVHHTPFAYVGHVDRIMRRSLGGGAMGPVVLDIKTCASPSGWHRIQSAAYAMAWQYMTGFPNPVERGCVYLQSDGSAGRLVMHKDRRDFEVWKAVLTVAKFKEENP